MNIIYCATFFTTLFFPLVNNLAESIKCYQCSGNNCNREIVDCEVTCYSRLLLKPKLNPNEKSSIIVSNPDTCNLPEYNSLGCGDICTVLRDIFDDQNYVINRRCCCKTDYCNENKNGQYSEGDYGGDDKIKKARNNSIRNGFKHQSYVIQFYITLVICFVTV